MQQESNIFEWLESIRTNPSPYARDITELFTLVRGYYCALRTHNIVEPGPNMSMGHFDVWAQVTTGWGGFNRGWGYVFDHNTPADADPFGHFFCCVDEYRTLTPKVTACVTLRP